MTPLQHNNYLSWAHFAHAGLTGGLMLFMMAFMTAVISLDPNPQGQRAFIAFMWIFIAFMMVIMVVPSFVAGYALRKRKSWAKTASIIAGVMASMSAPFGTAVCVYTFWFLFSEPGKLLYEKPQRMLPHDRDVAWNTPAGAARERQYVTPPSPPDWR